MNSAFCESTDSPGLEGQSILATVAIHAARNSRLGSGCAKLLCEPAHKQISTTTNKKYLDFTDKFLFLKQVYKLPKFL